METMMRRFLVGLVLALAALPAAAQFPFSGASSGQFQSSPAQLLATWQVVSQDSGTFPVTFGVPLPDGASMKPSTNIANSQTVVRATHNSGYARLVQITVRPTFTAGVPIDVEIYSDTVTEGADLTTADIVAAAPTASVQFSSCLNNATDDCTWTSSLAALDLTTPFKITAQGPEMIEAQYNDQNGDFLVQYFVRVYSDGRKNIRVIPSNGLFPTRDLYDTFEKVLTPTVTIEGTVVWNNGGSPFTMHEWTGVDFSGWGGGTAPSVTFTPDTDAIQDSGMVSHYWKGPPSETELNAQYQVYAPLENGGWLQNMSAEGEQKGIGEIANWDVLCLTSGGDPRACNSVRANARALRSYATIWPDASTQAPIRPSERSAYRLSGLGGSADSSTGSAGPLLFEFAHHGSSGYLAYILDAHPADLQMAQMVASIIFFTTSTPGNTELRRVASQTRTRAWGLRSWTQAILASPDDGFRQDFMATLTYDIGWAADQVELPDQNDLGMYYSYTCTYGGVSSCKMPAWMDDFAVPIYGRMDEGGIFADETDLHTVRDFTAKLILGRGGPGGLDAYCYNVAAVYTFVSADVNTTDTTQWFKDTPPPSAHKKAYDLTCTNLPGLCEEPLTACSNTLRGISAGAPSASDLGYWGYWRAGLGSLLRYPNKRAEALVVLNRIKGATNGGLVINPTSGDYAVWSQGDPADWSMP